MHGAAASRAANKDVPGAALHRLCGSGLEAVGAAARASRSGEASLMIAGGVDRMSYAKPSALGYA